MESKLRTTAPLVLLAWFSLVASSSEETVDVATHSVTEQVSEGLNLSADAKAAVTYFFQENGRFPIGNAEAGLADPRAIQGKYVVSVTITRGVVSAEFGGDSAHEIYGRTIESTPMLEGAAIEWSCSSRYIAKRYWPQACQ